jgi:tetratricopeptide (TPR) repeat protein/DNA-binding SARP family transcriptional activator/DNA-binding XRE family transcriptional regulator
MWSGVDEDRLGKVSAGDVPRSFGEFVRTYRVRAGVTQEELAQTAGMSVRGLRDLERNRVARPRVTGLRRLAEALKLSEVDRDRLLSLANGQAGGLYVGVLGPLLVHRGEVAVEPGTLMQRRLLGLLAIQHGQVVPVEEIVDVLWGQHPPRTCQALVRVYASRLRERVGAVAPARGGYQLVIPDDRVDLAIFAALADDAAKAHTAGDDGKAVNLYETALGYWRGPALVGLGSALTQHPVAVAAGRRRTRAALAYADLAMGLGQHERVADVLAGVAADEPFDEALHARLLLAMSGAGQHASALRLYTTLRTRLKEELGVEPGAELQAAHRRLLERKRSPVPAQLPADVRGFTGREQYLRRLDGMLPGADRHAVALSIIAAGPGVGKTALALRWAHRVREEFPDGQLYVNLHGYGAAQAMRPIDVLATFLPALGVRPKDVPDDLGQAVALYRSLLADKRVLVVLDNANSAHQVRPLLPGGAGCLVLVTSRNQLRGLVAHDGAVLIELDVLAPDEATTLLAGLLTHHTDVDPASVAEFARLCGFLPLALRIAAANLIAQPMRSIADYVAELAADQLAALEVHGDPETGVRSAFDHSYAALPTTTREMFRRLGVLPGDDFTAEAAAALADLSPLEATVELDRLVTAHLVEQHRRGRYTVHDLIRHYAGDQAHIEDSDDDRRTALTRLHDFYLGRLDAAARRLYPHLARLPMPTSGTAFDDDQQALAWLETELPNLVAAIRHAAERGPVEAAWRLGDALHGYFYLRMQTPAWQVVAELAVTAAQTAGDQAGQAAARLSLATLHWVQGHYKRNIEDNTTALALARATGWAEGESAALGNLGTTSMAMGQLEEAVDHYTEAVAIDRRTGSLPGLAAKLGKLGLLYSALGRLELATEQLNQAAALRRQTGTHGGEARVLYSYLGKAYLHLGRFDDARATLARALAIHRAVGDRYTEADSLRILAAVQAAVGHHDEALEFADAALALAREIGDRRIEADALTTSANIHRRLGDHQRAVDRHTHALRLALDIGHRSAEIDAHLGLAADRCTDQPDKAAESAVAALALTRRFGYRINEAKALTLLAAIRLHDDPRRAAEHAEHAVAIYAVSGHRLGEAHAHRVAERAHRAAGDERAARLHQDQASALATENGRLVTDPPD